ncbi:MAG: DUF3575 domain-containing protein [Mediterranea massiliensis]|nr:DUF3575 domain-containing protein [Mediterranea massiliensis]
MLVRKLFILLVGFFVSANVVAQVAVKTNLPMDALLLPNLGIEFGLSKKWTLDVPVYYSPFMYKDNKGVDNTGSVEGDKMLKLGMIQPELRYWLCDKFNGHFFGFHLMGGVYHTTGIDLPFSPFDDLKTHRYKGEFYGGGISYGYQFVLGRHWNLGLALGLGYAYVTYDKYKCEDCTDKVGDGSKNYFGPTKAALNLIYVF